MDGYKLARQLRASERTSLVPIVFLTAKDETADRIEGFRAGIDAYLTKPFEPDELLAVVNAILNRVERTHSQIARLVSATSAAEPSYQLSGRRINRCGESSGACGFTWTQQQGDSGGTGYKCSNS